ncbi:MAG: HAMP domain-containing sensor histidine kinase [Bacteroidales bacterium]
MDIYYKKKRWKIILGIIALVIVMVSLWYSNILARHIALDERRNATIWADAIRNRVQLVHYTQEFFEQIKAEERKHVEILAEAFKRLGETEESEAMDFYLKIISDNNTIPVIITDSRDKITLYANLDMELKPDEVLAGELKREFSVFEPVIVRLDPKNHIRVYYKESKTFTQLRAYLEDLEKSFISEVVANSASVPVIITDMSRKHIVATGNIDRSIACNDEALLQMVQEMAAVNEPIEIQFSEGRQRLIFYKNSYLLTQLKYYPYFQFGVIVVFITVAYLLFSTARKSEQNQVWAGLAKETAHQLGTPLSAIMAWIEILKLNSVDEQITDEMEKDVARLQVITERFSKIGSAANLQPVNIVEEIQGIADYLKTRTTKKIKSEIHAPDHGSVMVPLNPQLFGWVIENMWKNAADAISGEGIIEIAISEDPKYVYVDFSDNGKGIHKSKYKSVFDPGVTSKQRGWGLGLSLARRIIEDYHKGKIFIKSSVVGKGTTFRIVLRK